MTCNRRFVRDWSRISHTMEETSDLAPNAPNIWVLKGTWSVCTLSACECVCHVMGTSAYWELAGQYRFISSNLLRAGEREERRSWHALTRRHLTLATSLQKWPQYFQKIVQLGNPGEEMAWGKGGGRGVSWSASFEVTMKRTGVRMARTTRNAWTARSLWTRHNADRKRALKISFEQSPV